MEEQKHIKGGGIEVVDGFKYSGKRRLDLRQECQSVAELKATDETTLLTPAKSSMTTAAKTPETTTPRTAKPASVGASGLRSTQAATRAWASAPACPFIVCLSVFLPFFREVA